MDNVMTKGFREMDSEELQSTEGGGLLLIVIGGYLIYRDLKNCYNIGYAEGKALKK